MILIWYHYDGIKKGKYEIMKLITRDTDYGVRAICYIAKKKRAVVSVSALVKELKIPKPFLRKILQILNKAGILKSYKGFGGGFTLAKNADKIFLTDLVKVFQGPLRLNECFFKKKLCPHRNICKLKRKMDFVERKVFLELKDVNIKSLIS